MILAPARLDRCRRSQARYSSTGRRPIQDGGREAMRRSWRTHRSRGEERRAGGGRCGSGERWTGRATSAVRGIRPYRAVRAVAEFQAGTRCMCFGGDSSRRRVVALMLHPVSYHERREIRCLAVAAMCCREDAKGRPNVAAPDQPRIFRHLFRWFRGRTKASRSSFSANSAVPLLLFIRHEYFFFLPRAPHQPFLFPDAFCLLQPSG